MELGSGEVYGPKYPRRPFVRVLLVTHLYNLITLKVYVRCCFLSRLPVSRTVHHPLQSLPFTYIEFFFIRLNTICKRLVFVDARQSFVYLYMGMALCSTSPLSSSLVHLRDYP